MQVDSTMKILFGTFKEAELAVLDERVIHYVLVTLA